MYVASLLALDCSSQGRMMNKAKVLHADTGSDVLAALVFGKGRVLPFMYRSLNSEQ